MTHPASPDPVLVPLPHRGVLAVAGADRKTFLNGLVSNEVTRATEDTALWSAFLTPQGKFLHEFFMVDSDETLLLIGEAARLQDLADRLKRYKLRSKVTLEVRGDWRVAVVPGDKAAPSLGLPVEAGSARRLDGGAVAFVDPRLAAAGVHLVLPPDAPAPALPEGGMAVWQAHRLTLGLPEGAADITPEKDLLLECGFEELAGIDFKKGCYMGQELTARTKYRGLVKKRLMPVTVSGPLPEPGTPIFKGGKDAGEMRSGVATADGALGLALVRLERLKEEGEIATEGGTSILTAVQPDWMVLPKAAE